MIVLYRYVFDYLKICITKLLYSTSFDGYSVSGCWLQHDGSGWKWPWWFRPRSRYLILHEHICVCVCVLFSNTNCLCCCCCCRRCYCCCCLLFLLGSRVLTLLHSIDSPRQCTTHFRLATTNTTHNTVYPQNNVYYVYSPTKHHRCIHKVLHKDNRPCFLTIVFPFLGVSYR